MNTIPLPFTGRLISICSEHVYFTIQTITIPEIIIGCKTICHLSKSSKLYLLFEVYSKHIRQMVDMSDGIMPLEKKNQISHLQDI